MRKPWFDLGKMCFCSTFFPVFVSIKSLQQHLKGFRLGAPSPGHVIHKRSWGRNWATWIIPGTSRRATGPVGLFGGKRWMGDILWRGGLSCWNIQDISRHKKKSSSTPCPEALEYVDCVVLQEKEHWIQTVRMTRYHVSCKHLETLESQQKSITNNKHTTPSRVSGNSVNPWLPKSQKPIPSFGGASSFWCWSRKRFTLPCKTKRVTMTTTTNH